MNDVIMSDADCTPGREPRSVAASISENVQTQSCQTTCAKCWHWWNPTQCSGNGNLL